MSVLEKIIPTLYRLSGVPVIPAYQQQPRPIPPFISLAVLSKRYQMNGRYDGWITGKISCQVFGDDGSIIASIIGGLATQESLDELEAVQVALSVSADVTHLGSRLPDERDVLTLSYCETWSIPEPDEGQIDTVITIPTIGTT